MMDSKLIPAKMLKLHDAFVEKTGKQPYLSITLDIDSLSNEPFEIAFHYRGSKVSDIFRSETAEATIAQAFKFIANLPSEAEQNLAEFQADLAKLIDKGRDYNIPLDFVNPLIATSKKLAENAIEHKGAA